MFVIGLLLLAAAVVVGVDIAMMNDQSIDLEAFNQTWTSSPGAAFIVGAITAVAGLLNLVVLVDLYEIHLRERDAAPRVTRAFQR
jgi:hypothetical protein